MTCLYSPEGLEKLKLRYRIECGIAIFLAAAAVVALVIMCIKTGTLNASIMENAATLVFIIVGWIEIYLIINGILGTARELKHATMLNTDESEILEGEMKVADNYIRIKGSITVRKVELKTANGTRILNVIDRKAKILEKAEGVVKLQVVHGYVSGFEVAE